MPAALNEVAQWIAIGVIVVLLVGLYRQLSVALGFSDNSVAAQAGPAVGRALPKDLARRLPAEDRIRIIAFVSESCHACQRLLADLNSGARDRGVVGILYHESASQPFRDAVAQIDNVQPLALNDAEWDACSVYTTPIICTLDFDAHVLEKRVSHKLPTLHD